MQTFKATETDRKKLKPQPGPQTNFLMSSADIAIYGGAAGGGKTAALLLEAIRYADYPEYGGVIFRRETPQIRNQGGLWDASSKFYSEIEGAKPKQSILEWHFKSGAKVKFAHMQHVSDKESWQGTEIPFIGWDELTHFTEEQFFYLLSRNRSTSGIKPYMRGTCNPDSQSWVRQFIDWWIDKKTGLPIPERCGVLQWFIRHNDLIIWADTPEEIKEYCEQNEIEDAPEPKSVTFIAATLRDNQILMKTDPSYLASLQAMPHVERERLLGGNWNISAQNGLIKEEWIKFYNSKDLPPVIKYSWSLDTAVKEKEVNDFSVAQLWAKCQTGYYLISQWKAKVKYPDLKKKTSALMSGQPAEEVLIEDKQSGQQLIQDFREETNYPIIAMMPGSNMPLTKIERVGIASTYFETGRVFLPDDMAFTAELVQDLCNFPDVAHDDTVDATSQYLYREIFLNRQKHNEIGAPVKTGGEVVGGGIPAGPYAPPADEKSVINDSKTKTINKPNAAPVVMNVPGGGYALGLP